MSRLRNTFRLVAIPLASAALLTGLASGAQAATPQHVGAAAAAHRAPDSAQNRSGADIYSHGNFSVQFTVHNDTDQPFTLQPDKSGSGGHWATRPQPTLAPGAADTVSGYSDGIVGDDIYLTYTLPNGEYACYEADDNIVGSNTVADGVGTGFGDPNYGGGHWYQTVDPLYQTNVGSTSAGHHIWADASIKPAA